MNQYELQDSHTAITSHFVSKVTLQILVWQTLILQSALKTIIAMGFLTKAYLTNNTKPAYSRNAVTLAAKLAHEITAEQNVSTTIYPKDHRLFLDSLHESFLDVSFQLQHVC